MIRPRTSQTRGGHDRWLMSYADLVTLLLSVHIQPRFLSFENEDAVAESLRIVTAAPKLRGELLSRRRRREVILGEPQAVSE